MTPFFFDLVQGCVFIDPSGTTCPLTFTTAFAGFLLGLQQNSLLSTLIVFCNCFIRWVLGSGVTPCGGWLIHVEQEVNFTGPGVDPLATFHSHKHHMWHCTEDDVGVGSGEWAWGTWGQIMMTCILVSLDDDSPMEAYVF